MRASMLIVTALLALSVPPSRAEAAAAEDSFELRYKLKEDLRELEETKRLAKKLVDCLQQGRVAGDPLYDDARAYLERIENDFVHRKADLRELDKVASEVPTIKILEKGLATAEHRADKLDGLLTRAQDDLAKEKAKSIWLEAQLQMRRNTAGGSFETKTINELRAKLEAAEKRGEWLEKQLAETRDNLTEARLEAERSRWIKAAEAEFESKAIGELRAEMQSMQRHANDLNGLLAQSQVDLAASNHNLAAKAAEIKQMKDTTKVEAGFKPVQTEFNVLKIAIEALDTAQSALDLVAASADDDAIKKIRKAKVEEARKARDEAFKRLKDAVGKLKQVLQALDLLTSQAAPTEDGGTVLQAGYFPHEDGYAPGLDAGATPPIFIDEGFPTIETIDGAVIESVPFLVPPVPSVPSFTPLDPPDAPAPTTPAHCVSRELPLDDPAGSWRLFPRETVVRRLPMPGDLDELSETSIATTMTRTATGDATNRVATMATTTTSAATTTGRGRIITPGTATRSIVFDCPAYFPIVRFKDRTKSYDDEGLRIVEGMVLRFDDEGRYEVEFQAQGIATPVVLRLQLKVNFDDPSSPIGSLTLPPIRLDPLTQARLDDGRADDAAWLVVHRGWSSRLRRAFVRRSDLDGLPTLDVRRDGAARFGSGLPSNRFLPR